MSRTLERPPPAGNAGRSPAPPLRDGDRLDGAEFERRYDAMPAGTGAELIEGVVHMRPPVSHGWHGGPMSDLVTAFGVYRAGTAGVLGGGDSTLRLSTGSLPQPDAYLLVDPALGGRAVFDADRYIVGAPELVAEVSASTAGHDLNEKLETYRRNGVLEYVVWRTTDGGFDQFDFRGGGQRRVAIVGGVLRSGSFPGLWLNTAALVAGDIAGTLAEVHRGLASVEHAVFAAELQRRRATGG